MNIVISAPTADVLAAAIGAVRHQHYAAGAPARWILTPAADGLSATLDTDSSLAPAGLPDGAAIAPVVPRAIALWQARVALANAGLLDKAGAAIRASGNPAAAALWEYGNNVDRESALPAMLADPLGLSPAGMDALFVAAAALSA